LALSTALSATLTAQLAFDPKHLKYCSTYNLAEGVDESNKKKEIYHLVRKINYFDKEEKYFEVVK